MTCNWLGWNLNEQYSGIFGGTSYMGKTSNSSLVLNRWSMQLFSMSTACLQQFMGQLEELANHNEQFRNGTQLTSLALKNHK